jgi:hypothetical protein
VEVAERYADGRATKTALQKACGASYRVFRRPYPEAPSKEEGAGLAAAKAAYAASLPTERTGARRPERAGHIAFSAWSDAVFYAERWAANMSMDEACAVGAGLLREVCGNPFRPITIDPSWRTPSVVALAQRAYEDRAFESLPVLADALEEAGCDHPDLLGHCRQPGEHVRGCWPVDMLLGKA